MATQVTLREEKFHNLWQRVAGGCQVYPIEAPGLVELVETGEENSPAALQLLQRLLEPYVGELDALVLGCTHYPFVTAAIRRILGEEVELFDGGDGTARQTRRRLAEANLLAEGKSELVWENSLGTPKIFTLCEELLNFQDE